jgi:hypothetical protein
MHLIVLLHVLFFLLFLKILSGQPGHDSRAIVLNGFELGKGLDSAPPLLILALLGFSVQNRWACIPYGVAPFLGCDWTLG